MGGVVAVQISYRPIEPSESLLFYCVLLHTNTEHDIVVFVYFYEETLVV